MLLCAEPARTFKEAAQNIGTSKDLLYRWRREYHFSNGKLAFPGNGVEALTEAQKRIRKLEQKLRETEMEQNILKKSPGHLQ